MKKGYRKGRISEEIKKIVSDMLMRDLKDPRLTGFISVTDVESADDGNFSTIYVSVMGKSSEENASDKEKQDVLDALNGAKGVIRRELGAQLKIRHTPDIAFKIDTSEEYSRHIEKIIQDLDIKKDED